MGVVSGTGPAANPTGSQRTAMSGSPPNTNAGVPVTRSARACAQSDRLERTDERLAPEHQPRSSDHHPKWAGRQSDQLERVRKAGSPSDMAPTTSY